MGRVDTWRVSPSQTTTFWDCRRKWAFPYIDGIKEPKKKATVLGSVSHKVLEVYFRTGDEKVFEPERVEKLIKPMSNGFVFDPKHVSRIALAAVPHYPTPQSGMLIEHKFRFTRGGVRFTGLIDLLWKGDFIVVADHKTSSDPDQWGLTAEQLLKDPQGLLYAAAIFEELTVEEISLQWTYLKTRGKATGRPVRTQISRRHVDEQIEPVIRTGHEILKVLSSATTANDLPPTLSTCRKYGGCPFRDMGVCELSSDQRLEQVLGPTRGRDQMGRPTMKELLAAKRAGKGAAAPTSDLRALDGGRSVNSPEASTDPNVQREISKGVGETLTRNRDAAQERAQAIAEAGTPAANAEEARERVSMTVADIKAREAAKKSPTPEQVLEWVCTGKFHRFTTKAKEGTPELPYCSGKVLAPMKKSGLLNYRKEEDLYTVMPTDAGREAYVASGGELAVEEPVPASAPTPAPAVKILPGATAVLYLTQAQHVWLEIAKSQNRTTEEVEELFEAFQKRFV